MPRQFSRRAALAGLGAVLLTGCTTEERPDAPLDVTPSPVPPVTVDTPNGPVRVPGAPTRVVVLDTDVLDSAFTLGVPPLAASRAPADPGLPDYFPADWLAQVGSAGTVGAPDYPAIRALRPELVLGNQTRDGAHYEQLRAIAPTVFTATTGASWKDDFQVHARALGRLQQAEAVATAYGRHLGTATEAIGAAGHGGSRISLVRFVGGSPTIRLYGRRSFPGSLLTDLRLARPGPQDVDAAEVEVTPEQIGQADGDFLFHSTYGDPATAEAVLASPAWHALTAVRTHRAFPVDDQLWYQGIGYTGANLVVAELQRVLTG
ncbi:ABC transporter substrate-binding protein [Kitasatospora sp. NPDC096147]|uniref:ABC transporter substrate-binding protein n=1 Tax=Kitasatospora sp. NPDC096147 TaxID=3364093 RepID=UPI0037FAFFF0